MNTNEELQIKYKNDKTLRMLLIFYIFLFIGSEVALIILILKNKLVKLWN